MGYMHSERRSGHIKQSMLSQQVFPQSSKERMNHQLACGLTSNPEPFDV
jgi:hypothetical protein